MEEMIPITETIEYNLREAKEAFHQAKTSIDKLAFHLWKIVDGELYKQILDERGLPLYPRFSDYRSELCREIGISRATFYVYLTAARIALYGLELSQYQFEELGGVSLINAIKEGIDYDSRTGEIRGLKNEVEGNPKEIIINALEDVKDSSVTELNLLKGDKVKQVLSEIGSPIITFTERDGIRYWLMEWKGEISQGKLGDEPEEVHSYVNRKLGIIGD